MSLRSVIMHLVVLCAIYSPPLASGTDLNRPQLLQELSLSEIRFFAISPDGTSLAIAAGTAETSPRVVVVDVATGKERCSLDSHLSTIFDVSYSPDGKQLVTASEDRSIRIWDSTYGDELWRVEDLLVATTGVALLKHGDRLITHSGVGTLALWNLGTGNIVGHVRNATSHSANNSLRLTYDESHVIAYSGEDCGIWELPSLKEVGTFQFPQELGEIRDVAVSKRERRIAVCSFKGDKVYLRDFAGRDRGVLVASADPAVTVASSPDGKVWAVCSGVDQHARIELFDMASGTVVRRWKTLDSCETSLFVERVAFSTDGKSIVTGTRDGIRIWAVK